MIFCPPYVCSEEHHHHEPEDHCRFDLWGPENPHTKIQNTTFSQYALSFELAARALANHPEAQDDESMQFTICREYGVFLDQCTEDELNHLFNLANEFMGV